MNLEFDIAAQSNIIVTSTKYGTGILALRDLPQYQLLLMESPCLIGSSEAKLVNAASTNNASTAFIALRNYFFHLDSLGDSEGIVLGDWQDFCETLVYSLFLYFERIRFFVVCVFCL